MIPKSGGKSPCAGTSCELHQAFPCTLSSCLHFQTCSPEFYISGLITTSPSHRLLRVLSGSSFHAQPSHTGLDLSKCSLSSVDLQIFISFSSLFFPQDKVSVPSFITHMCLLYSTQAMCGGSAAKLCLAFCDPVVSSTPGSSILHCLPEFLKFMSLTWWGYLTTSFSATPFFCLQSFPASGLFQWVDSLESTGGQSIGASASASVLPMNSQGWFPLGLTGLISKRLFYSTTVQTHQFFGAQSSLWSTSHICTWLLEKPSFDCIDLCQQNDVSVFFFFLICCLGLS